MNKQQIPFPLRIPFVETLALELWAFGDGHAELQVQLDERHLNSWRVAHGGLMMTMLDVAMAHAARSVTVKPGESGPGIATIEMKTSFLRAAEGRLKAEGRLIHRTTTLAFCEGRIVDEAGDLCAHATGTFKYLSALPTKGRHAQALNEN